MKHVGAWLTGEDLSAEENHARELGSELKLWQENTEPEGKLGMDRDEDRKTWTETKTEKRKLRVF
jgi:hypothetical protein